MNSLDLVAPRVKTRLAIPDWPLKTDESWPYLRAVELEVRSAVYRRMIYWQDVMSVFRLAFGRHLACIDGGELKRIKPGQITEARRFGVYL